MGLFKTTITTSKAGISSLEIEGKPFSTAQDIANDVNSFLRTLGSNWPTKFHLKIYHTFTSYADRTTSPPSTRSLMLIHWMCLNTYTHEINSSKATGPDDIIPSKLLKLAAPMISNSLSYLFNRSLQTGVVGSNVLG